MKGLPNLDFMRAYAVMLVWIAHFGRTLGWKHGEAALGMFGVLIFFVHTSLVLMLSMERTGPQPLGFYIRRIFCIYPLSIITVLAVLVFRVPCDSWGTIWSYPSLKTVLLNLALMQNLNGSPSVLAPLWSLSLEIQMYVLLPLLFILVRSVKRGVIHLRINKGTYDSGCDILVA
jgi:peptidoglycan/LPS O-acetylase OafA/YrhL